MSNENLIYRNFDVITHNDDLEILHTYPHFPTFMGCVNANTDSCYDQFENMQWYIGKKSGIIQLNPLLPLEMVYLAEHGSGTVGKIWDSHHTEFSKFIHSHSPSNVLEIGGGSGVLAEKCLSINPDLTWTIIDPNPSVKQPTSITIIRGFFDDQFQSDKSYNTIIHSHVIEHVYDIDAFFKQISSFAKDGMKMIFSVPNLQAMLEQKHTNCLNFEHTTFVTYYYVEYLLSKYNFKVIEKTHFNNDHSIFYCVEKTSQVENSELPPDLYTKNKQLFLNYISHYQNIISEINETIDNTTLPVYLFGAHIFSQYLIFNGLNCSTIKYILDNDEKKQNKRLYGTNFIIKSPEILRGDPAIVILKVGFYEQEIKNSIDSINKNITYL